jgi:hypothetical protein
MLTLDPKEPIIKQARAKERNNNNNDNNKNIYTQKRQNKATWII